MQSNVFLNLTSQECSQDALSFIQNDLEERLKQYPNPLNEDSLKDALHFTNMKFLKSLKRTAKAALSCLIVIIEESEILIAGIGHYKVYAIDDDFLELVFQDPLNAKLKPGLSEASLLENLKNALGRPAVPLIHVRKLKRTFKPDLLVADYNTWSQVPISELKNHSSTRHINFKSIKDNSPAQNETPKLVNKNLFLIAGSATALALTSTLFFQPESLESPHSAILTSNTLQSDNSLANIMEDIGLEVNRLQKEISNEKEHLKQLIEEKNQIQTDLKTPFDNYAEKTDLSDKVKTHVVMQGETLSIISQKYYGTSKKAKDIFEANKDSLPSQNYLKAGTKLVIP